MDNERRNLIAFVALHWLATWLCRRYLALRGVPVSSQAVSEIARAVARETGLDEKTQGSDVAGERDRD